MNTVEGRWFKSTYSSAQGDDCVEVAFGEGAVLVRDSKDTVRPHLTVRREEWCRLLEFAART
ncbi:DUF397 domain-containing protein [Streptomyces alkaliphilus]|uniref:DUF397 domain-containing protein n=1 Tax=Streptomyces alkaliphilus TaxID=1472722 RepID=A0A7W3TAC2_9ACTN|nr:DUF397 domain-containing protein [Streptomyces alkaliphilus]MBB0243184.1 DUF397 domain-containing protein [Streptomyces alkaliphilus]